MKRGLIYNNSERNSDDKPTTIHIQRPIYTENQEPDSKGRITMCGVLSGPDIKRKAEFEHVPINFQNKRRYKLCGQCKMLVQRTKDIEFEIR